MPLIAAAPPQHLATPGGFDYVTVDSINRRVYAAHTGGSELLIVDADTGKIRGYVKIGPPHGVAVNPDTGHVYAGIGGDAGAISEIDPVTMKEVNRVTVEAPVDAIVYDVGQKRIYADEDNGTRIFVIDATTFKELGTVSLPGQKPEYIQVDQKTHQVFQSIADVSEIAVIDPTTLMVWRAIQTPEIQNNHPLQYDEQRKQLWVLGENKKLSIYSATGKLIQSIDFPTRVDQCSLDQTRALLACAGDGQLTVVHFDGKNAPAVVARASIPMGTHTLAFDPKTDSIWIVWGNATAAYVQRFSYTP